MPEPCHDPVLVTRGYAMQTAGAGVIIRFLATKRVACNRCSVY